MVTHVYVHEIEHAGPPGRRTRRRVAAVATALGLLAAAPALAAAQTVSFAGFTNGCFGLGCVPPTSNVYQQATLGGLGYQNATFSSATLAGFAGIGNTAAAVGAQNSGNLGAFYLASTPQVYSGQSFTLQVTFTAPGSATQLFTAALTGSVAPKQGGLFIDFDNAPQSFAYASGGQSGVVSLSVNDVSLQSPAAGGTYSIAVSGNLTATATPEPATFALLAPGLVGVLAIRRRRAS